MESHELTLRLASAADAGAIDALMKGSIAGLFPAYYDERQTASSAEYVASVDRTLIDDGTYFVVEAGGDLVACGGWSKRRKPYAGSADADDDMQLLDPRTDAAHVRAMFVRPDWTRRGLAGRILSECEAAAFRDGFRMLDLVATLPGIPFYRAAGFEPTADIEDVVLADGVTLACLEMAKTINSRVAASIESSPE